MDEFLIGPMTVTFVIGIISVFLLYWYSTRNHDYWKKKGIPTAKTIPFFGSVLEIITQPFHEVEERRYKQFGRLYGHLEMNQPCLSVAEPYLLREIFVKDFLFFHDRRQFKTGNKIFDSMLQMVQGEDWKRIRSIVTPTFSTGKIKRMMNIFKECSRTLVQNFRSATDSGETVDAKRFYGAFTMDVIASSAFSTKINSHNDPDNKFVQMARKSFSNNSIWKFILFFLAPRLLKLLKINVFENSSMDFFVGVTHQLVEERKRTGLSRNDFLQLLIEAAKEVTEEKVEVPGKEKEDFTSNYEAADVGQQVVTNVKSKHLSMDELVAQSGIFFAAGYETTASILSFTTYRLAIHPGIQKKLRKEVDDILKSNNGQLNYEAIQNMKYLDNIISETLRLYPPVVRLERSAAADYELGDTGITIKKGMLVSVPIYAMHRDPEFHPEPEKFDPDRFKPEEKSNRDQYTYLPFGAGPRNCVGMRFALIEIKMCLAHVIANFIIKRCSETKVPLELFVGQGLLQPKETILIKMEIRDDCPLSL